MQGGFPVVSDNIYRTAIKWAKETKGIVALSFHWFSPIGRRDKSFMQKIQILTLKKF